MNDCLIIGGGAIGLSLAYELAGRGQSVTLIERGSLGAEASWAGAGILPPAVEFPQATPLERLTALGTRLHLHWAEQLRQETGIDNGLRRCGAIYLQRDPSSAEQLGVLRQQWQASGIAFEPLSPERLAELEPALQLALGSGNRGSGNRGSAAAAGTTADVAGAAGRDAPIFLPDERQIRNPRHLQALSKACALRGVELLTDTEALAWERGSSPRGSQITGLRTSRGTLSAANYCVTSGAWSSELLQTVGFRPTIRPVRGQIALLHTAELPLRHIVNVGSRYLVPRDDGHLLIGSTEEDVGFDKRTTSEATRQLLDFALELVPALKTAQLVRSWAGLRPASVDRLPYLGALPEYDNLFIAAGHFRSGLHLACATAQVMAEQMLGEATTVDLHEFRVERG